MNWIISFRNIPNAMPSWVVVDVAVGVDLELEKEIVNWVELRKSE